MKKTHIKYSLIRSLSHLLCCSLSHSPKKLFQEGSDIGSLSLLVASHVLSKRKAPTVKPHLNVVGHCLHSRGRATLS